MAAEERKNFPIDQTAGYYIDVAPTQRSLVAEVRSAILALMRSVIFLLLIACANVANLLLVRASLGEREFAVRAALGASRWRLIRPLLTEAALLAVLDTVVGLGLAWAGIHELRALAPANLPRLDNIRMDRFVLGYTALAGLEAAAIFGIAPAWRASRPELMDVLRGRTSGLASGAVLRNLVAGVGLYGLLATAVWQRTSEIGVRMTLGAERSDILRLVVLQGVRLSVIFFAVEAVAAFVLARVISAMLVGVKPADPVIFASMAVVFFAISALASWLPARRAAGFDPPDRPARTVRLF